MNSRLSCAQVIPDIVGLTILFERGVWPIEDTSTPPGQQN
jgi:hypothetical protein